MKTKLLLIVFGLLIISNVFGFDGKRKGFLLGFGLGYSNVSYKQTIEAYNEDFTSPTETEAAFATDFKIGFAPNESFEIYYSSKVAWFSIENIYENDVSISDGVGTISVSYFTASGLKTPGWVASPFVSAGFGFSAWSTPSEKNSDSWTGSGFFVGGGYEFAKHYRLELNYFSNNPSIEEDGYTFTTESSVIMLTISAMAF